MAEDRPLPTLEESLLTLLDKTEKGPLLIGDILTILSGKGKFLILIFLSLPFCLPLQIPGLSVPFGLIIALIGFKMTFGKQIWLPKCILTKSISKETVKNISDKSLRLLKKIKRWVHPRLKGLCHPKGAHLLNGLMFALLGIFLAIPLPIPLTNLTAGWSIFLIALGLLEDDGVFVLIGYFTSLLTTLVFFFLLLEIKKIL